MPRQCSMIKAIWLCCAIACPLLPVKLANAATIYVPAQQLSIQSAINAAAEGDEIVVSPNIYTENIHFLGKNVLLRSNDPQNPAIVQSTILDGQTSGPVVTFAGSESPACILSGFTITNGLGGISGDNRGTSTSCEATIRSNRIVGNSVLSTAGAKGGGISHCNGTIEDNLISTNTAYGGAGLWACEGIIQNNIVSHNLSLSYSIDSQPFHSFGGGLLECGGTIQNNVIASNSASGSGGGLSHCFGAVRNNTIWANGGRFSGGAFWQCSVDVRNCIVWNNWTDDPGEGWKIDIPQFVGDPVPAYSCIQDWTGGGLANTALDPLIIDPAAGHFELQSTSPCIDAGGNAPDLLEDLNGQVRPFNAIEWATRGDGSDFDIGAYEYSQSIPSPDPTPSIVNFPDVNLDAQIRLAINKPTGPIFDTELAGMLSFSTSSSGIVDLSGMQYCTGLHFLTFHSNPISDISPLSGLINLENLNLTNCHIVDIDSLTGLTNLTSLYLSDNQIQDISPLETLSNLRILRLDGNLINDITPLAGLLNLNYLALNRNSIQDIEPLVSNNGLTTGNSVFLAFNPLDCTSINQHIPTLVTRGVGVTWYTVAVCSVTPQSAPNNGLVSITDLHGAYLQAGATIALRKNNETTITATDVEVLSAQQATCDFDLIGATPGSWDIVLVNPDQTKGTLRDSFLITPAPLLPEVDIFWNGTQIVNGSGPFNLGTARLAGPTVSAIIRVENNGIGDLHTAGLSVTGGFVVSEGLDSIIPAGNSDNFTIELATQSAGYFRGAAFLQTDDNNENPYTFIVEARITRPEVDVFVGNIPIDGSSDPVYFGTNSHQALPTSITFKVENNGGAELNCSNLRVPNNFSITDNLSSTIGPFSSDTFTVQLNTQTTGTFSGTVDFINSDNDESPYTFIVEGIITNEIAAQWEKVSGDPNFWEKGESICASEDGGFVTAGTASSLLNSYTVIHYMHVVKFNIARQEVWNQYLGNFSFDAEGAEIVPTSDGGYAIAGSYAPKSSADLTKKDAFLVRLNAAGARQWTKRYGGTGSESAQSLQQAADGGFILCGTRVSSGRKDTDFYVVKTDSSGNEEWSQSYGGPNDEQAFSIRQTSDLGYLIAGFTRSSGDGGSDYYAVKTDQHGIQQWSHTYGGLKDDECQSVLEVEDGGYILCGSTQSFGQGDWDVWLVKTDDQGDISWQRSFGGNRKDRGYSIIQTGDKGFIIVGETTSIGFGLPSDLLALKVDFKGNLTWNHAYGARETDFGRSITQTLDGGYVAVGATVQPSRSRIDLYMVKIKPEADPLRLASISPALGNNSSGISTIVRGENILPGATARLCRNGNSDVVGSDVQIVSDLELRCNFDLTSKSLGLWDIVVTNPNRQQALIPNAFAITLPSGLSIQYAAEGESDALQECGGACCDGEAVVVVTSIFPEEGEMEVSIQDFDEDGTLGYLLMDNSKLGAITVAAPLGVAKHRYLAPAGHPGGDVTFRFRFRKLPSEMFAEIGTANLPLRQPPLLFIHGIWSSNETWGNEYLDRFTPLGDFSHVYYTNYRNPNDDAVPDNDASFSENGNVVPHLIDNVLNRSGGATWFGEMIDPFPPKWSLPFSSRQVDLVCHSMGGILARWYIQGLASQRPYKGDINKLITLGTPHSGAYLADILLNTIYTNLDPGAVIANVVISSLGFDNDGAVSDMRVDNGATDGVLNAHPINSGEVPIYAIAGDALSIPTASDVLLALIDFLFDSNLYDSANSDLIVPIASAKGGLGSEHSSVLPFTMHFSNPTGQGFTQKESVAQSVLHQLILPDGDPLFASNWNPPDLSFNPFSASRGNIAYARARGSFTLRDDLSLILSSATGTLAPGESINLEASGPSGLSEVLFAAPKIGYVQTDKMAPFKVDLFIPKELAGELKVFAIGKSDAQIHGPTTTTLQIVPADAPIHLFISPDSAVLPTVGDVLPIAVYGKFPDGNVRNLSEAGVGTLYWVDAGSPVIEVSPNGMITSIGEGSATVTIRNRGVSATCQLRVLGNALPAAPMLNRVRNSWLLYE